MMPFDPRGRSAAAVVVLAVLGFPQAHALTLAQAERLLEQRNPDIAIGAAVVESARGGLASAGQRPNPTLNAQTVNYDPDRGVGSGPPRAKTVDTTVGVQWLVERGEKRERRLATAQAQLEAARLDWLDVRRSQRLALHYAYYDLKQAEARARLLGEGARLASAQGEALDRRVTAGDAAPVERARLAVEAARVANEARGAEADLASAREVLATLLGQTLPADALSADDEWPEVVNLPPLSAVDAALRRPDLKASQAREEAARASAALAESQAVRDVTVGAQVEHFPPDMRVSYGVLFSIPLFVSHRYEGEIARAKADADAARLAREKTAALARSEAMRARAQLASAGERLERLASAGVPAAESAAQGMEFAYARGAVSLTDLLDARRQLRALQLDVIQARVEFAKAWATWRAGTEWGQEP
jgi:cobalt-zinc-cadmium efflux system outer membrane protein